MELCYLRQSAGKRSTTVSLLHVAATIVAARKGFGTPRTFKGTFARMVAHVPLEIGDQPKGCRADGARIWTFRAVCRDVSSEQLIGCIFLFANGASVTFLVQLWLGNDSGTGLGFEVPSVKHSK